jgi:hypothetical protein
MSLWKWKEIQELLWKKSVISRVTADIKLNINNKKHLNVNDLSTNLYYLISYQQQNIENADVDIPLTNHIDTKSLKKS